MAAESASQSDPARPLLLGSGSPRRRSLLAALGVAFDVATADIDEEALVSDDAAVTVERTARAKFEALGQVPEHAGRLMLTADTLVACEGRVLGKPTDLDDARAMVRSMSGRPIDVVTFVWLGIAGSEPDGELVTTRVQLSDLGDDQIEGYLDAGVALDKAGALELQGAAAGFIAKVEGCWSNVVGLPICTVAALLDGAGSPGSARCSGGSCGAGHG